MHDETRARARRSRTVGRVFASALVCVASVAQAPALDVSFSTFNHAVREGDSRFVVVRLNRTMNADDPAQVTVDVTVESSVAEAGRDYVPTPPTTLTFVNGGSRFALFPVETLDDDKYEGTERLILRLVNPVGVDALRLTQAAVVILDDDPYDPALLDDFESYPYLWRTDDGVSLDNPELPAGDPLSLPGQGAFERVLEATVPLGVDIDVRGRPCGPDKGVVPVVLWTTETFDAASVDPASVTFGRARETHVDRASGVPRRHAEDVDGDGDLDLVFHFRSDQVGPSCASDMVPFHGRTYDGRSVTAGGADAGLVREFAVGRDWNGRRGLRFWYHGEGTGDPIAVEILDNRAPDPGPAGWDLVWADEFDDPAGTPPDPARWGHEIGDGTINGIPGWGNAELQYYTDSVDNVATDGRGNLVITAREGDGSVGCFYGPCRYTSARLVSAQRAEFAYGRIESRMRMPDGDAGLWPAFWSLGTDIDRVGWPRSGEIDLVEYVSRSPYEVFGTVHGPGYSGSDSYGDTYVTFPERISDGYRTFAVEWQPDRIEWFVDGVSYHIATPADVAPSEWVFNGPVFLILNMAVGGYFGGPVSPDTAFPQSLAVDYVRVYQATDTAERWQARFHDDFHGWREIDVPFGEFVRAHDQPAGAPDDGLNLDEVRGYGFRFPEGSTTGRVRVDHVRLAD